MFFLRYIPQNGGRQNVQVRKIVDFSNFKRLYLRSETVSDEKSQGKNENFGALRAPAQTGRRKNKRKSFLIFVSSDQKPQKGAFRPNLRRKQGARSAREILRCFYASEASRIRKNAEKVVKNRPFKKAKSGRGRTI